VAKTPEVADVGDSGVPFSRALAAAVHFYTALGAVLAFLTVLAAFAGDVKTALALLLVAGFVDGTDGLLSRRLQVKEHWPDFDGTLLDNIVDYLTYVFAPVVILWHGGFLPSGAAGLVVASLPLMASSYQFCRTDAKTDDHFFLGFPSYWNVVAFYAIALGVGSSLTTVTVVVLSVLAFVPIRYVYPSRSMVLFRTNMTLAGIWFLACIVITVQLPAPGRWLVVGSLGYIGFYLAESLWITVHRPQTRHPAPAALASRLEG
jgi:phosphatidylcholine synthase